MNKNINCPKCNAVMEEGFILDLTYGARLASRWVAGKPEPGNVAFGFKSSTLVETKDRDQREVQSFRCTKCAYLEFYASDNCEKHL